MGTKIGKRLHRLRSINNLTVSQCAKYLEVSPSTYREWEYGRKISGEPYIKLAKLFKVSVSEILGAEQSEILNKIERLQKLMSEIEDEINLIKADL